MKALALILALAGLPAYAQPGCGPHDAVIAALENTYGETVQTRALQQNQTMIETLANLETGTWTILITTAEGVSCSPASGDHFAFVPQGDPA